MGSAYSAAVKKMESMHIRAKMYKAQFDAVSEAQ